MAEEEKGFYVDEEHDYFDFQKCSSPVRASPGRGYNSIMQQSLEHMRLFKKIESSADESSMKDLEEFDEAQVIVTGTYEVGSIAHMEMPDLQILESVKSGMMKHRRNSDEFELDCIMDCSNDFSRTLIEQIQEHKRSLLDMINELDGEGDIKSEN